MMDNHKINHDINLLLDCPKVGLYIVKFGFEDIDLLSQFPLHLLQSLGIPQILQREHQHT